MRLSLSEMTIERFHEALKESELTAVELVNFYLKRIETLDEKINAIICINKDALAQAKHLDAYYKEHGLMGALHGVPVLVKDNFETKNLETTAGSLSLKGFVPDQDAFLIEKIKKAGGIVIAKANLHEFAIWGETISSVLGQTLNPYDLTRTPGGSSGGTGAGIAADFALIGLGTDTINSVRSPASANNLVGIRPTLGLLSRSGIIPYSYTQDTAGPITRTLEDAVIALEVMKGFDPKDQSTRLQVNLRKEDYREHLKPDGLKDKKIGVMNALFGHGKIHHSTNVVVRAAIEEMKQAGAEIISIDIPINSEYLVDKVSVHLHDLKEHLNLYLNRLPLDMPYRTIAAIYESGLIHEGIRENFERALTLSTHSDEYLERILRQEFESVKLTELFEAYGLDAIVYPHQKQLVCKVGDAQLERNGTLSSVTGFPSICIPSGFTEPDEYAHLGVPIGMEILGRPFTEAVLIEIAFGYESKFNKRKTPLGF